MPAATRPPQPRERRGSLVDRLASAHGHLRAIRRMAEEGHPCPEVIYQLRAVRSALVQAEKLHDEQGRAAAAGNDGRHRYRARLLTLGDPVEGEPETAR